MDDDHFWGITEALAKGAREGRLSAPARSILGAMSVSELLALYEFIEEKRKKLYVKEVLEVGAILNGMELSDDGVSDFTCWLVFEGKETFELVLSDPDRLAEIEIRPEIIEEHDFDGFGYDVLEVLLAKAEGDSSIDAAIDDIQRPEIEEWYEISSASLARRYPRLWEKYGARFIAF